MYIQSQTQYKCIHKESIYTNVNTTPPIVSYGTFLRRQKVSFVCMYICVYTQQQTTTTQKSPLETKVLFLLILYNINTIISNGRILFCVHNRIQGKNKGGCIYDG